MKSTYNEKTATRILLQIEEGNSLVKICKEKGMPSHATVHVWLEANKSFQDKYARARLNQADWYADKITDIANAVLQGRYKPENARVAIDALKWTASKLKPKKYGDRLDLTSEGEKIEPLIIYRPEKLPNIIEGEVVKPKELHD